MGDTHCSLGKTFSHPNRHYWYDTNRNTLYEIDATMAAVLPIFAHDNDAEVHAQLRNEHPESAVQQAIDEISVARAQENMFALAGPEAAVPEDAAPPAGAHTSLGHLTLSLSERCNLRCRYCTQASNGAFGDAVMTPETALKALRWFAARCADAPVRMVSFYGGEPLLHFELVEAVVKEARRHPEWPPIEFTLDTNATLIDDRMAQFIVDEGLRLQVSLDGPPEVHDRHRRLVDGQPTHAAVMTGLRRLLAIDRAAARQIHFAATVTPPYDYLHLCAYFEDFPLYNELAIPHRPHVRFNTANLEGTGIPGRADQWRLNMAEARNMHLEAHLEGRRAEVPRSLASLLDGPLVRWHHRQRRPLEGASFPAGACRPGSRRVFVAPDGTFLPCERAGAGRRIGHVDSGLDADAIVGLHKELLDLLADDCRTCWARRLCHVCFTSVKPELPRAEARLRLEQACESTRREAKTVIEVYLQMVQQDPRSLSFLAETRLA